MSNAITTSPLYTLVSVVSLKAQSLALYSVMYTTPLSTLISSMSLNHHLYADDTQLFLSFHPSEFHSYITHLQNALQQISFWMTANLLTLNSSKTEFILIGLKQQLSKIHDSLQPTLLATLALSLMNTLPYLTKSLHFLNPATTITFVNFAVSAHISTSKQPAPLPPPLSILNLITVTLTITTFQTINLTGSNRYRTHLLVLLLRLLNPHISLLFSNLSTDIRSTNALNINCFLLPTKFLQPVNLAILTVCPMQLFHFLIT